MNQRNSQKLFRMMIILVVILLFVGGASQIIKKNSQSLTDYAAQHPNLQNPATDAPPPKEDLSSSPSATMEETESSQDSTVEYSSLLIGASLNGESQLEERIVYGEAFYYEPLSDNLKRYITGISFPASTDKEEAPAITYDNLRYVHVLHYDFNGRPSEGELICNEAIAPDLVEIFYELYCNEYYIEKIRLIEEYDGNDTASMEDNNTSCFNYRTVEGSRSLSKHALGLAIDINPLYNPYITYHSDGTENVSPTSAAAYADRSKSFPYKIDENDLCYKLFMEHGFIWGGNWNSCKDYQHFQKTIAE